MIRSVCAQADTLSSEITLKTFLEADNIPLNREVVYHVELSWFGELDDYQINEIVDPVVTGLSLRGSGSSNKLLSVDGRPMSIRRVTYYFTPQALGMAYIDGLSIQYKAKADNKNETLFAQRISVKIIEPVETGESSSFFGTFLAWTLLIGFILLVSYFLFRYFQRKDKGGENEQEKTIEDKYLDLLNQTIHLSNNATKENVIALQKLISSYIAEKFSIPGAIDKSIILDRLKRIKVDESQLGKIKTMLDKIELARFAAEEIDVSELHAFYDSIEFILNRENQGTNENGGN